MLKFVLLCSKITGESLRIGFWFSWGSSIQAFFLFLEYGPFFFRVLPLLRPWPLRSLLWKPPVSIKFSLLSLSRNFSILWGISLFSDTQYYSLLNLPETLLTCYEVNPPANMNFDTNFYCSFSVSFSYSVFWPPIPGTLVIHAEISVSSCCFLIGLYFPELWFGKSP